MSYTRPLDYNKDSGIKTDYIWNDDGTFTLKHSQDVEGILKQNAILRNEGRGFSKTGDLKRLASIPMLVYYQWLKEGFDMLGPDSEKELKRRLNMPEYAYLRTSEGSA